MSVDLISLRKEINQLSDENLQNIGNRMSSEDIDTLALLMPDEPKTHHKIEMLKSRLSSNQRAEKTLRKSCSNFAGKEFRKL